MCLQLSIFKLKTWHVHSDTFYFSIVEEFFNRKASTYLTEQTPQQSQTERAR